MWKKESANIVIDAGILYGHMKVFAQDADDPVMKRSVLSLRLPKFVSRHGYLFYLAESLFNQSKTFIKSSSYKLVLKSVQRTDFFI